LKNNMYCKVSYKVHCHQTFAVEIKAYC